MNRGDYATALRLTHEQASHGRLSAWHNLGYLYENGLGVRTNLPLAVAWYHACADLGDADCQNELGRMSYAGIGMPRDPVEAYKWLLLTGRESAVARQNQPIRNQTGTRQVRAAFGMGARVASEGPPVPAGSSALPPSWRAA